MSANELETLFLDWWNFPGAMQDQQFGRAKTLQRLAREGNDLNGNLSIPFLSSVIRHTTQLNSLPAAAETSDEIGEKVSLLDRYLLSRSSIDKLIEFEKILAKEKAFFVVTFESGGKISGPLADLCAVRLAGIILHRPSPVFYDENYEEALGESLAPTGTVASPQLWLPTKTGSDARSGALAGSPPPAVPLFLYFLSGNYLPDLHGYLPPTSHSPDSWRGSLLSSQVREPLKNPPNVRSSTGTVKARRPLWEPVRLGLLASIFLSRKIMPFLPRFARRPLRAVDKLAQPWRGNSFLTRGGHHILQFHLGVGEVSDGKRSTT